MPDSRPSLDSKAMAALSPLHLDNIRTIEDLPQDLSTDKLDLDKLISLLHTIDYCLAEGEIPSCLFPHIYRHADSIVDRLEGLGVQKEVRDFLKCMSVPAHACERSARLGRLDWLQHAHMQGFMCGKATCYAAAEAGSLVCLKYAHEMGAPLGHLTCVYAAGGGHSECMRFAMRHGAPLRERAASMAAAKGGNIECLRYLKDQGIEMRYWGLKVWAAKYGHLDCLQFLHEEGVRWSPEASRQAAAQGHLSCLRYALENLCPWHHDLDGVAARHQQLECLRYLTENQGKYNCVQKKWCSGLPICLDAIEGGNVECLRYVRERIGAWWTERHLLRALNLRAMECALYMVCKDKELLDCAARRAAPWVELGKLLEGSGRSYPEMKGKKGGIDIKIYG